MSAPAFVACKPWLTQTFVRCSTGALSGSASTADHTSVELMEVIQTASQAVKDEPIADALRKNAKLLEEVKAEQASARIEQACLKNELREVMAKLKELLGHCGPSEVQPLIPSSP